MGEVLFWSLRQCLGEEAYTLEVHSAWIKIYCHMLKIMVPLAVAHELKDGSAQEKRFYGSKIGLSNAEQSALSKFEGVRASIGGPAGTGGNSLYGEANFPVK